MRKELIYVTLRSIIYHIVMIATVNSLSAPLPPCVYYHNRQSAALCTLMQTHDVEHAYAHTHYCLYHGCSKEVLIAMLANTYLDHLIYGTPLSEDFIKLRTNGDLYSGEESLSDYMEHPINDRDQPYKSNLLAVNLSFPGNVHNETENAWRYFKHDHNNTHESGLFSHVAQTYARSPKEGKRIQRIMQYVYRDINQYPCGVVIQVCIPKSIAPSCVYISTGCGRPHTMAYKDTTYSERVLHLYQNDQEALHSLLKQESPEFHARGLQARIRLDASIFFAPGSVKVFAYYAYPRDMHTQLYQRLQSLITEASDS